MARYFMLCLLVFASIVAGCGEGDDWPVDAADGETGYPDDADGMGPVGDDPGARMSGDCDLVATSGKGKLEMCDGVRVVTVEGSPYEMGYQTGVLLREPITQIIQLVRYYTDPWGLVWGLLQDMPKNLEPGIRPEYAEEMRGLVDGLNNDVTYEEIVAGNALGDVFGAIRAFMDNYLNVDFCSLTAAWGDATADGEMLVARNFDYMNIFHDYNYVAIVKPDSGHAFVHTGITGLIGTHVGMNENGLTGSLAYNSSYDSDMRGVPMLLLLREAIQYGDSVEDAMDIIRASDRTMGLNYMFTEALADDAGILEVSGGKTAERRDDERQVLIATNHYVDPEMAKEQKGYDLSHTTQTRYKRLNDMFDQYDGRLDIGLLASIMRDHWDPELGAVHPWRTTVCRHDDLEYTPHTIMADLVSTTTPSVIMKPIDGLYCTTITRHACEMPYFCLTPFDRD